MNKHERYSFIRASVDQGKESNLVEKEIAKAAIDLVEDLHNQIESISTYLSTIAAILNTINTKR